MRILQFYGINFCEANYNLIIELLIKKKGYLVMPAASALVNIKNNFLYYNSLKKSTVAIFDSGFFCILLFIFKFLKFKKFSGYKFLKLFMNDKNLKDRRILLLDPTVKDSKLNNSYLKFKKFKFIRNYICPIYDKKNVEDKNLLILINKYKPHIVIINIGGLIQEPLALYIKNNSSYKLISICSGAAISYFTGSQVKISDRIDNLYMGWVFRIIHNPKIFFRVIKSIYLVQLVFFSKPKVV
jgi:N-acetylglucosaminyldiphosphoundecaprenol N-acetyl-beta-D-mannosaminyltransferase